MWKSHGTHQNLGILTSGKAWVRSDSCKQMEWKMEKESIKVILYTFILMGTTLIIKLYVDENFTVTIPVTYQGG